VATWVKLMEICGLDSSVQPPEDTAILHIEKAEESQQDTFNIISTNVLLDFGQILGESGIGNRESH
jgi:hypothetical protein